MAHLEPIFPTLAPPTPPDVMTYEIPPARPVPDEMNDMAEFPPPIAINTLAHALYDINGQLK